MELVILFNIVTLISVIGIIWVCAPDIKRWYKSKVVGKE